MSEHLDVFNEIYEPLDPPSAPFDEVHKKGLWHQTFACWLVNEEKRTVVLQLRGPKNSIDPGSLDASAGGHVITGESPEDGFRELKEELGLEIPKDQRFYLGMFRNIALRGAFINHEFCHVYLAKFDKSLHAMTLEDGEVDGVFEVNIDAAIDFFAGKAANLPADGYQWERQQGFATTRKFIVKEDMCNWRERCEVTKYYLKVMLAAKGLIDGERVLVL
ncbi:MAG: NUDIX domain-containing protein [Alphaproteobacteria bacterium]